MEWNSMGKFIKSLREGVEPQTEATMMKDTGEIVHDCAKHVEHAEWGRGATLAEEHAAPDAAGNIAWYDIMFEHGLERQVPTESLNILVSEAHVHAKKKMKEAAEPKTAKEKSLAAMGHPKDKITHKDVLIGRGVLAKEDLDEATSPMQKLRDAHDRHMEKALAANKAGDDTATKVHQQYMQKITAKMNKLKQNEAVELGDEVEILDELSKKTLGSYVKGAADRATHNRRMAVSSWERADRETDDKEKEKFNNFGQDQFKKYKKRIAGVGKAVDKLTKEDLDLTTEVDETIEYKTVSIEVNEADKNYDGYFKAAMKAHGVKHPGELKSDDEKKKFFNKVDAGFKAKNEDVFVEAWMRSDVAERIAAHTKAGNKVSDEQHTTKGGEGHHSFVVTEPSGKRTRHIFHGNSRKLETMSPAPKSKEAHETGEDEDDK